MSVKEERAVTNKYQLLTATSMGVRITPANHQPAGIGNLYTMTSTRWRPVLAEL